MEVQKEWYSSLSATTSHSRAARTFNGSTSAAARELGAIAANSNETAREIADVLPVAARSNTHWKFSSAVIASNENKKTWPKDRDQCGSVTREHGAVESASARFLDERITSDTVVDSVAIPADEFLAFLEGMTRREAREKGLRFTSQLKKVRLLPPVGRNVSLQEIVAAISKSVPLMGVLEVFECTGASAGAPAQSATALDDLGTLFAAAKKLTQVTLCNCEARDVVVPIADAVKDGTMEHFSLESNDLGSSAEEVGGCIADVLRHSKFLLSLNLANNNLSSDAASLLFQALLASDTTMTPDDLAEQRTAKGEPEEKEPVPAQELVDRVLFFGDPNDEENSHNEEEEEEEEGSDSILEEEEDGASVDEVDVADDGGDEAQSAKSASEGYSDEEEEVDDAAAEQAELRRKRTQSEGKELHRIRQSLRELCRAEHTSRAALQEDYLAELLSVVAQELEAIRARAGEEKQREMAEYCRRRSGWSRLQSLVLRGNTLGDRGARALAKLLRSTVALSEEELTRSEEELRGKFSALVESLRLSRRETLVEEQRSWRALAKEATSGKRALLRAARAAGTRVTVVASSFVDAGERRGETDGYGDGDDDDDDEYSSSAPPVVMTNVETLGEDEEDEEDEEEEQDGGDGAGSDGVEVETGEEEEEEIDWGDAAGTVQLPVFPIKPGMNSITFLDVGSCRIGTQGLATLASALAENTTLTTLLLRNNCFFTGKARGDGGATASRDAVLTGFAAFAEMLATNVALTTVDLGYCGIDGKHLRALAAGLARNTTLNSLNLEGNELCSKDDLVTGDRNSESPSALLALLTSIATETSALKRINLSHNAIGDGLWADEVSALAAATSPSRLTHLYLSNTGLRTDHLQRWTAALLERHRTNGGELSACSSLETIHLARNRLAGEEAGQCIGDLLALCASLRELNVDENPQLTSTGLAAALNSVPVSCTTTMEWLSCNGVGATAASVVAVSVVGDDDVREVVEEQFVVPPHVMHGLRYLALGDLDVVEERAEDGGSSSLAAWATQIQSQALHLQYLSLWSRHVAMEENLQPFTEVVSKLPTLRYADFGVLLRFDMAPDLKDCLGQIERTLVGRRVTALQASA